MATGTSTASEVCLLTPDEAARRLGLGELQRPAEAVLRAGRRGLLRLVPIGKYTMVASDSVAALCTAREAAARLGLDQVSRDPERMVHLAVGRGDLERVVIGRTLLIRRWSLDQLCGGRL